MGVRSSCRRRVEGERQGLPALPQKLPDLLRLTGPLDGAEPVEQRVVEQPRLHSGQMGGDAEMRALAEGRMLPGVRAGDVVRPGVLEHLGVAIAGVEQQVDPLPGPDWNVADL